MNQNGAYQIRTAQSAEKQSPWGGWVYLIYPGSLLSQELSTMPNDRELCPHPQAHHSTYKVHCICLPRVTGFLFAYLFC